MVATLSLPLFLANAFPTHGHHFSRDTIYNTESKANCCAYRSASSHACGLQMPDDGSQLRKIMTSMTQSCACVCVTPSFRDGRQRPPTQLALNSFHPSSSISILPLLPLNRSSFTDLVSRFVFSYSSELYNFLKASSFPFFFKKLCFFSLSKRFFFFFYILRSFLSSFFFIAFYSRNIPRFSKSNCHSLFPFTNATRRPRYIVTIRTLICVSSRSAHSP